MTKNKEREETHLADGISHTQACSEGWKIRINRNVTGHDKRMWIRVEEEGKTKENV